MAKTIFYLNASIVNSFSIVSTMEDCAIVDHKTETEMSSVYISAFMNLVELIMVIALNTD